MSNRILPSPLALIDGNCQGDFLSAILTWSGLVDSYVVETHPGYVSAYRGVACRYIDDDEALALIATARKRGQSVFQVTQSTALSFGETRSYSGAVDQIVGYPHLQFYAQNQKEFQTRFGREIDAERIYRLDLSTVAAAQKRAGSSWEFGKLMIDAGREMPLFPMTTHPSGVLFSKILADLLRRLDVPIDDRTNAFLSEVSLSEGINFATDHPIPISIQRKIGVAWGGAYEDYCEMLSKAVDGNWDWILVNANELKSQFPSNTQVLKSIAVAAIRLNRHELAPQAITALIQLCPGSADFWILACDYFRARGELLEVDNLLARAKRFFGPRTLFDYLMYVEMTRRSDPLGAEHHARKYCADAMDRNDILTPLLSALTQMNKMDQVVELSRAALARPMTTRKRTEAINRFFPIETILRSTLKIDEDVMARVFIAPKERKASEDREGSVQ